jgi:hypothetical protein
MSSPALTDAINNLQTAQSVELQQFVTDLRSNPENLSGYIQKNRDALVNDVLEQRSDTFNKVYGDAVRASNTQNNIYYYYTRNKDLDTLQKDLLSRTKYDAESTRHDKDLAQRQYEINEWSYGNKMDTLFVFQMILVALALLTPLLYFSRQGLVPTSILTGVAVLFAIIIALTIAVRAQYTAYSRDQRYWNRRQFDRQGGPPIPIPSCETLSSAYDSTMQGIQGVNTQAQAAGSSILNTYNKVFSSSENQ